LNKLRHESDADFHKAALQLDPLARKALFALAAGDSAPLREVLEHSSGATVMRFLRQLCEPEPAAAAATAPDGSTQPAALQLLPPYGAFSRLCLDAEGKMVEHWNAKQHELGSVVRRQLQFFADTYAQDAELLNSGQQRVLGRDQLLQPISTAVLESLAANGVGLGKPLQAKAAVSCAANVDKVPALKQLLHDCANSKPLQEHDSELKRNDRRYDRVVGFHVLRWLRNVDSHGSCLSSAARLQAMGLRVPVIRDAVGAAVAVLQTAGHARIALSADLVPFLK